MCGGCTKKLVNYIPFNVGNVMSGSAKCESGLNLCISVFNKFEISSRFLVTTISSNQFDSCFMGIA